MIVNGSALAGGTELNILSIRFFNKFLGVVMKFVKIALLSMAVFGMSGANAEILASAPTYAGSAQKSVVCYIFNAGTGPVNISNKEINIYRRINDTALLTPLDEDTCPATLTPGSACHIRKFIVNTNAHACRLVFGPTAANVRARFEIRDANDNVLQASDLR